MLKDISDKMNVWADQAETGIASIATFTMMYGGRKKKLYGPLLWMGFNCLIARATSRRQFTFYH